MADNEDTYEGATPHFTNRKLLRTRIIALADGRDVVLRHNGVESKVALNYLPINKRDSGLFVVETGEQLPLQRIRDAYPKSRTLELKSPYSPRGATQ
ncbi:hypothetical protein J4423_00990 [Candidatus Pacearchaeota archaeon]|nr:hypothetical protein [Candidatus Pacearchaeota archaeon]